MTLIEQIAAARRASVPLLKITTTDPAPVMAAIHAELVKKKHPVLRWDVCSGIQGISDPESAAAALLVNQAGTGEDTPAAISTGNPVEALQKAQEFAPVNTLLFMLNGGMFATGSSDNDSWKPIAQAIWNCRDPFKSTSRTLVLIGDDFKLPGLLKSDVIELVDPVPTREDIARIVRDMSRVSKVKVSDEDVEAAVECLAGVLSQFLCENIIAMSFVKKDDKWQMDFDFLWSQSISAIERTSGLKVIKGNASFDQIGGLDNIKGYLKQIVKGKRKPTLVVLLDELEKQLGGIGGDSSGVSQDAYGQLLTAMNDYEWQGILFPGFPGTGKTECAKAMGAEAGGLFVMMDMGGMKGSLVGQSEQMIRNAVQVLKARGGDRVFFVGTVNDTAGIPAPLFRRMSYGTFFFDLPTLAEQKPIWDIYRKKYGVEDSVLPSCDGWTGAEIKQCCRLADELEIKLVEAAQYVSPVVKTMGEGVDKLRKSAAGKYFSASEPGVYQPKKKVTAAAVMQRSAPGAN